MTKILCFGEALIDFLNVGSENSDGISINSFCQFPGGAPANVAVAISKLGGNSGFIGQVGDDLFGDFLQKTLDYYKVNTDNLFKHPTAKTALAFVFVDEAGEREFSFYRQNSADVIFTSEQLDKDAFTDASVFHFCSNTLTEDDIANTTSALIDEAISKDLTVSFDVNLRHNLWKNSQVDAELVNQFVEKSTVLKFSREEIEYLTNDIESYVSDLLGKNAKLIVITNDGDPIRFYAKACDGTIVIPRIDAVDTTAAGDAFSGGLLYQIAQDIDVLDNLNSEKVTDLVGFAAKCGAFSVTRQGAFPSLPTLDDLKTNS